MKEFLGVVAVILGFVSFFPYIRDILKGKTQPHLYTYIIWGIVTALAFFGQYVAGAGPGAWTTGVMEILTLFVLALCFRYGTKDITGFDTVLLVIALVAIIPWFLTKDPTVSIVIATLIDVCAFLPTIRKTLNDADSETLISWVVNLLRHGVAIFALTTFTLATYIYPAALLFMNAVVVSVIVFGKRPTVETSA